jgi:hypothetical protein
MRIKFLAVAAVVLCPAVAFAQEGADTAAADTVPVEESQQAQPAPQEDTSKQEVTTEAAGGEVAPAGGNVSEEARQAQKNAEIIGSPAWWSTRATADGKPLKGGTEPESEGTEPKQQEP